MKSLCRGWMDWTDGSYPLDCYNCHKYSSFSTQRSLGACTKCTQSSYLSQISQIIFVEKKLSSGEISAFDTEFEQFMEFYQCLCRCFSSNLCGEKSVQRKSVWRKMTNMWSVFTMLTLLKRLTLLALILCMNTLFFFDCFCHQELKNGAHNGLWKVYAVFRMGWMGRD